MLPCHHNADYIHINKAKQCCERCTVHWPVQTLACTCTVSTELVSNLCLLYQRLFIEYIVACMYVQCKYIPSEDVTS